MKDSLIGRPGRLALLLYPRAWRRRYPDFVEILASELEERPWRTLGDVLCAAAIERLRGVGILPTGPDDRAGSGLALMYAALVPFAGLSLGMWSQLRTGLVATGSYAPPVLQTADLLLAVGTVLALASLAFAMVLVAVRARRGRATPGAVGGSRGGSFVYPALVFIGSISALTVSGWAADRSGWYSPAAAALPDKGAGHFFTLWIRGVVAAVTPAWVHPALFGRMPPEELLATFLAPIAALAAAVALLRTMMHLPVRAPGHTELVLVVGTAGTMLLSLAAAVRWVLVHPTRQGATRLFTRSDQLAPGHTGWGVVILLAALAVVALVGARRVLQGRSLSGWPRSGH
jgi:hypothetical protein